ncbi:MAG TPA: ABC transporter [Clostridiaceae bacterium]|nr:ABC transporter [Clostridiaceae bacterium]HBF76775.1 ABC transporter [Clostridiaceae bacterium]HBG37635.1 ABC transporter [Clostridiaceae bacterium]HBN28209.1 ABC transporter [Clostridiaceae bacterium]HBX48454.1 ABC transporter [Clostridiaceae bacterium]
MIECENLIKIYKSLDSEVVALQGLDLTVNKGELMAIIGNSGSGKSTLLNMIGGLDRATAGKLYVDGKDLFLLNEKEMIDYKRNTVGFVWQNNARNLIPYLTVSENIQLVLNIGKQKDIKNRTNELIELVGLSRRKNNCLSELSGGEQQRTAIAIALANNPSILLADEPTGSVDTKTASQILDVFRELNHELKLTIVIVTHDRAIASKVDRVAAIRDGRLSSEFIRKKSYAEELKELKSGIISEDSSEQIEYAVIDKFGRVQIPNEYLDELNIKGNSKVKVEILNDKIIVLPPEKK